MQNNTGVDFVCPFFCLQFKKKKSQSKHDARSVQVTAFLNEWDSSATAQNIQARQGKQQLSCPWLQAPVGTPFVTYVKKS